MTKDNGKAKPRGRPFKKKSDSIEPVIEKLEIENIAADCVKTDFTAPIEILEEKTEDSTPKEEPFELIEKIEFRNGENTLTLRYSKKYNRTFRLQIFLNDNTEIRPITYTGISTGNAFWNLIKGSLKK